MNDNIKIIRFIDSDYKELFNIPDGGNIKITYPPGDDRGTIMRQCKFLDEYHIELNINNPINNSYRHTYHICEFVERMEAIGARYEPEVQLRNTELIPFVKGEEKYYTFNREEGNSCIGHISGDFGNDGERFNSNWLERENSRNTLEFQTELHSAVYSLRQSLLQDYDTMLAYCRNHPESLLDSSDTYKRYGFKLETDTRHYYTQCFLGENMRDARFIVYAYDKSAPELEILKPMSDWCMSKDYQGAEPFKDGSRPLLAETSLADIVISGIVDKDEVFIGVYPHDDHYYEGHIATKELACQIGTDIVNHINTNTNMDVQFTDGSFKHFFTGLQIFNIRIQDSIQKLPDRENNQEARGIITQSYTLAELIKIMEPQARRDKVLISECIVGLGLYAAQIAQTNSNSSIIEEMRKLIENLVGYWGFDAEEHSLTLEDYLQAFDDQIFAAKSGAEIADGTYRCHTDTIYGLHRYGEEMAAAQGNDAMSEILNMSDLIKEIAMQWDFEPYAVVDNLTERLRAEVRNMLEAIPLPGQPISGENVRYKIKQAILFNNDRGFALAHNPNAPAPFVTWQFTNEGGKLDYYWGHYMGSEERAQIDYISRVTNYKKNYRVTEKPMPTADRDSDEKPSVLDHIKESRNTSASKQPAVPNEKREKRTKETEL